MTKKVMSSMLAIFLSLCFIGTGLAMEKGNKRKGKYTYRKVYTACNERGGIESPKPPISPDGKTQAQWERLFDKLFEDKKAEGFTFEGYKDFEEFGCAQEWTALPDEDLTDIFTYMYEHAADSPTPAKCK